jgi:uncharacterized phage protein (TIGR01671 family)
MLDKLKFRVWCKNKNEWEGHEMFLSVNGDLLVMLSFGLKHANHDKHIVMLCTGLKDCNQILSYEKDIVSYSLFGECYFGVIVFKNGCFGIIDIEQYKYYDTKYDIEHCLSSVDEFKIIGNIYQNPELLKVKQQ